MLSEELRAILESPLDGSHVKTRQGKFSYLETHYVKRRANEIFGYDGWSSELDQIMCVGCDEVTKTDDNGNVTKGWRVGYIAVVKTTTLGGVIRSDVGYGDAVEYGQSAITCHELASKEAASDALKRAMSSYGDQFGLILYDKDRGGLEGETGAKRGPRKPPRPKERTVTVPPELQQQVFDAFEELRKREPDAKAVRMYDKAGGAEEVPYWPLEEAEAALAQAKHINGLLAARAEPELVPAAGPAPVEGPTPFDDDSVESPE